MLGEDVSDGLPCELATSGAFEPWFGIERVGKPRDAAIDLLPGALLVVQQRLGEPGRDDGVGVLIVENHMLGVGGNPGIAQLGVEGGLARLARAFKVLHAQPLRGHNRRAEDGRAVPAREIAARAMLGPEGVDDLRAFIQVAFALVGRQGDGIDRVFQREAQRNARGLVLAPGLLVNRRDAGELLGRVVDRAKCDEPANKPIVLLGTRPFCEWTLIPPRRV